MNEFYMQRHLQLWEDNNKRLNRIVFLTVVLSLALVIKVLVPFVDFSEDKKPVIESIENLNIEKDAANKKIETIGETQKVLEQVNSFIRKQPWQDDKEDLIQRYRDMRDSPPAEGYPRERYQQEADNTINKIAGSLHENIFTPLQNSLADTGGRHTDSDLLVSEIDSLDQFIVDWKQEYINKNWYRTIERKDMTMYQLTESLNQRLADFSTVVNTELSAVKRAKNEVDQQLTVLNNKIETNETTLRDLDEELQEILPQWLRGLVKIEQVIQLLPVFLLASAFIVLGLGISLTRHYNIYTAANKFSTDITADPGMSTTWTLIYRGFLGSLVTIAAYTSFIIFAWMLFEESMTLLSDWLSIDPSRAWVSSIEFWLAFLWLSRACFIVLLIYIFMSLKRILFTVQR